MKKTEKAGSQRTPATKKLFQSDEPLTPGPSPARSEGSFETASELRKKAEQRLGERQDKPLEDPSVDDPPVEDRSEIDVRALVHELQVHQIELEMQNEDLLRAQSAAEEVSRKYTDLFAFAPSGYFLWDQQGTIREVNLAGAALLGLDRSAVMNKRFAQFVILEDRPEFAAFCQQALLTDAKQTCQVKLRQGEQVAEVLIEAIAAQDREGKSGLCRAAVIDISQQKRADELAAANQALAAEIAARKQAEAEIRSLAEFPEENPNPTLRAAGDGTVLYANQPAIRLLVAMGWQAGQPLPEELLGPARNVLEGGGKYEFDLCCRRGRTFSFAVAPSSHAGQVNLYGSEITDRKRAEQALVQAKTAAEAANLAKGQFLANMSHELRTPMNAIMGMIDVALPKAMDPTIQDCLQTAKGSADLLLTLLNDLLDSAKIESGKLELESAPFNLRRMLDQITHVLSVRASEKGLCFSCRMPDGAPDAVIGDRIRLQQVLLNLAGNAIKFTERGEVGIRLRTVEGLAIGDGGLEGDKPAEEGLGTGDWGFERRKPPGTPASLPRIPNPQSPLPSVTLEFAVEDTGIGIPLSGQERLFQPFAQADASMARRFGGTGLGLSICKSLVEMMGGRLWVESDLGKGSTFYFTVCLPLAKELPADFEAPIAIPTAACAPLRILLVEDNPANQKLATYVLEDRGHTVEVADNGQEAISLTAQNRYDVLLMDVQMPGMDGLEATAAIRKCEVGGRRVPIIAMTAHAFKGDAQRCLTAGMDAYLSKPIQFSKLIEIVESIAAKAAASPHADSLPARVAEEHAGEPLDAAQQVFCRDEALASVAGEEDLLREMVRFFFDDGPKRLAEMQAALEHGDAPTIARAAHGLKGTVIYLGARPALETLERLEPLSGPDDLPLAVRFIPELQGRLAALAQALAAYHGAPRP